MCTVPYVAERNRSDSHFKTSKCTQQVLLSITQSLYLWESNSHKKGSFVSNLIANPSICWSQRRQAVPKMHGKWTKWRWRLPGPICEWPIMLSFSIETSTTKVGLGHPCVCQSQKSRDYVCCVCNINLWCFLEPLSCVQQSIRFLWKRAKALPWQIIEGRLWHIRLIKRKWFAQSIFVVVGGIHFVSGLAGWISYCCGCYLSI